MFTRESELTMGQYYFGLDGLGGFVPAKEPLPVKKDGTPLSLEELVREKRQEVPPIPEDLPDPEFSQRSLVVLRHRYLLPKKEGGFETPKELLWRVASNIAWAEKLYGGDRERTSRQFYEVMARKDFLPNSPTLMNAGAPLQQLSACFVLPVEDNMESIVEARDLMTWIHKSGGGTGFNFSKLRPKGSPLSTGGASSGPLTFIEYFFDATTEAVKQGGKRRGANMGIFEVTHPEIEEFIKFKSDGRLSNFNISVAVTEEFMRAVEAGESYDLVNPHTGARTTADAQRVFDLIVENAHRQADPGIIFLDRINKDNPTPHLGSIESTNPCGEQPLLPYESCNLGSINLGQMVKDGEIDWQRLEEVVEVAVHFLDNVIDMNNFPDEKIAEATLKTRKIGLGVMGFADMLVKLWIQYDSEEAVQMAGKVMKFVNEKAHEASMGLAEQRGSFPAWEGSVYHQKGQILRNATVTTIAPTGSIAEIADCSSGIEPVFALRMLRKDDVTPEGRWIIDPQFERLAEEFNLNKQTVNQVLTQGSVKGVAGLPKQLQVLRTAHEISSEWHVRMQAAFQENLDNAVSKTINFPHDATVEDVRAAYLLAWKLGCKGITIYRDGSKGAQVLYVGETGSPSAEQQPVKLARRERPRVKDGKSIEQPTQWGKLFATLNVDGGGYPIELFNTLGRGGSDLSADTEAISRLVSGFLQHVPREYSWQVLEIVVDQLGGIKGGTEPTPLSPDKIYSLPDGIARALRGLIEAYKGGNLNETILDSSPLKPENPALEVNNRNSCPECHEHTLIFQEGCFTCRNCGYSKCG